MFLKFYLVALSTLLALDALWLGLVAKNFYQRQIGFLLGAKFIWPAAVVFYLIFALGIVIFVVVPATESGSWKQALLLGGLFGLIAYAAYDLTNLATIKNWPLLVTIVDMAWGASLAAVVSVVTWVVFAKIK